MDQQEAISILLIESDEDDALLFQKLITKRNLNYFEGTIHHARSLEEGIKMLQKRRFSLIVTELALKDSSGFDTFLRVYNAAGFTPIIVLSSIKNEILALETVSKGAQDYIPKTEMSAHVLARAIRYALERSHLQESLRALSLLDELTGLYNRRGFMTLFEQHLELATRMKQGFELFLIDLDYLKEINDRFGHRQGDMALKNVAHCLKLAFRTSDIIGRIGGDEFAIIGLNVSKNKGEFLKNHLIEKIEEFNRKEALPYALSLCVGSVYCNPKEVVTIGELLELADEELYLEKKKKHLIRMHKMNAY